MQIDQNWSQNLCLHFFPLFLTSSSMTEAVCIGFCPRAKSAACVMKHRQWMASEALKIRKQAINPCFCCLYLYKFLIRILCSHFQLTFLFDSLLFFSPVLLQFFFFHFSVQSSEKTPVMVFFISAFASMSVSRMFFQVVNQISSFSYLNPLTR